MKKATGNISYRNNALASIQNLQDLKKVAFSVEDSILLESIFYPTDYTRVVDTDFDRDVYSCSNDILAFVSERIYYVVPFTEKILQILKEYGFEKVYFNVIFSDFDQPAEDSLKRKWNQLKRWKEEIAEAEFSTKCEEYCAANGINAISESLLRQYCLEMPMHGIKVKYSFQEKPGVDYPAIRRPHFDNAVTKKLGTYTFEGNNLAFVYRNGKTYVTQAYWLVNILDANGYKKGNLFVPFCNNEKILEDRYHQQWEKIKIVCAD